MGRIFDWRDARAAERAGLENRCGFIVTEGSNPSLSAIFLELFEWDELKVADESHGFRGQLNCKAAMKEERDPPFFRIRET